jgi:hypothetical protein
LQFCLHSYPLALQIRPYSKKHLLI